MNIAYDTARTTRMVQHRDDDMAPDDDQAPWLPAHLGAFIELDDRPADKLGDQEAPDFPPVHLADVMTNGVYTEAAMGVVRLNSMRRIWDQPPQPEPTVARHSLAFAATPTTAPLAPTVHAPLSPPQPTNSALNMFLAASPARVPDTPMRQPDARPAILLTSTSYATRQTVTATSTETKTETATAAATAASSAIGGINRTTPPPASPLAHPTSQSGKVRASSSTRVPATSSAHDSGALRAPGRRLSDGFVILISLAVAFVCVIMVYYYIRRRRRSASDAGSTNGRSILSSHSGMPSVGADDEEKCLGPGAKHTRYLPDSGASISYQSKGVGMVADRRHAPAVSTHPSRFVRLQLPEFGGQFAMPSREHIAGHFNHCASGASGQSCTAPAKSDIYDCVIASKGSCTSPPVPRAFMSTLIPPPVPAAIKRGSISVDQISTLLQHPAEARAESGMDALKGALLPLTGPRGADMLSHSADSRIPEFPMPPSHMSTKRSLLDTTSANPGRVKKAAADDTPGPKIKPRKLTRSTNRQPSKSTQAKAGSRAGKAKDISAPVGPPVSIPPSRRLDHALEIPGSEAPGIVPVAAPLAVIPQGRGLPLPMTQANDLSLFGSIESLSDSYQFAVRHNPPLGPLPAVEPHLPALPDELRVRRGDDICVLGEFADGWVMAVNTTRGNEFGMIPRRCLFFPTAPFMSERSLLEAGQLRPHSAGSTRMPMASDQK